MEICGLVLAAGGSRRMGRCKQLLLIDGRPLVQQAIDALSAGGLTQIVVVLGAEASAVDAGIAAHPPTRRVVNPAWADGQATSLAAGLAAADDAEAVVVALADEPGLDPDAVRAVWERIAEGPEPIVRSVYADGPGHPVALHRQVWEELRALTGDEGARAIMPRHEVAEVPRPGPRPADIDTPSDYRRASEAG